MIKYLELCVELRKSYVAKEGIYQYKIICQQTQIKSFEDIVRKYLELAEEKAEEAKSSAQSQVLDVDDLDNAATPENILLSAVSSEDTQDRTDRVVLLPWVKFLWESYRQCLDLLKNNARTERLYHDVAHEAFKFCIKFNRKTEFRKLCDNLHAHLDILKKQQQQLAQGVQTTHNIQNIINLNNAESQALHLETRLLQLNCAIEMELWQEAYKATDDIRRFHLMNLSKKPLKPQLMASYYSKLALVFLKANCPLFHAAALFRHFMLTKEMRKNIKEEEIQKMASRVVAATLSMPIPPTRPEIDKLVDTEENVVENHQRNLASLLGLTAAIPTRASLIRDLKRMGVLNYAYDELKQLYNDLEVEFLPLTLCKKVETVIEFMEKCESCPELKLYTAALKDVTVIRLLKEVSQVYQTIEYKRLLELCPFADPIYLEKKIVDSARRNDLQVRVDHRAKALHFGTGRFSQTDEVVEGPYLQPMPSSQMRQQLVTMFATLQKVRSLIDSQKQKQQREEVRRQIMISYERHKDKEHVAVLARQDYIEARKEEIEMMGAKRDEAERKAVEEKQAAVRAAEEERMRREAAERAERAKDREAAELTRRMAMDTIEQIKRTEVGQKLLETLGEEGLAEMKVEDIKNKQFEQLQKEHKEQILRQQKVERKHDHLERAKRLEEIKLLEEQYEKQKVIDKAIFEAAEQDRIKQMCVERDIALQHRDRLLRMRSEAESFANVIKGARSAEFEQRLVKWQDQIDLEKEARLKQRKENRVETRRREWEAEQRKLKKEREELALREEMAKRKEEQEQERAKLEDMAQKQRQREAEIEAKMRDRDAKEQPKFAKKIEDEPRGTEKDEGQWRTRQSAPPKADQEDKWGHERPKVSDTRTEGAQPWRAKPRESVQRSQRDEPEEKPAGRFDDGRSEPKRLPGRVDDRQDEGKQIRRSDDRQEVGKSAGRFDDERSQGRSYGGRGSGQRDFREDRGSDRYVRGSRDDRGGRNDNRGSRDDQREGGYREDRVRPAPRNEDDGGNNNWRQAKPEKDEAAWRGPPKDDYSRGNQRSDRDQPRFERGTRSGGPRENQGDWRGKDDNENRDRGDRGNRVDRDKRGPKPQDDNRRGN